MYLWLFILFYAVFIIISSTIIFVVFRYIYSSTVDVKSNMHKCRVRYYETKLYEILLKNYKVDRMSPLNYEIRDSERIYLPMLYDLYLTGIITKGTDEKGHIVIGLTKTGRQMLRSMKRNK